MPAVNLGPSSSSQVNTQSPAAFEQFIQSIAVSLTPVALVASTSAEQSYGANGVSQVTAATGIKAGDVVLGWNHPSLTAGTVIGGIRVDPAVDDKFYIVWGNCTAGTPTPAAGLYILHVARPNVSTRPQGSTTYAFLPTSIQSA